MADWTDLTDAELSSGKPALYTQVRALRDNVIAVAAGEPGAPEISHEALYEFVAGTVVVASSDVEVMSNGKVKEIQVPRAGTLTVSFDMSTARPPSGLNSCSARIYVNGTAVGTNRSLFNDAGYTTFTEDITVAAGDLIQIVGVAMNGNPSIKNFRLKSAHTWQFVVNL